MASFGDGPQQQLLRHREVACLSPKRNDSHNPSLYGGPQTPMLAHTSLMGSTRLQTVRAADVATRIALHPGAGALDPADDYVRIANSCRSPQADMAPSTPTRRPADATEPRLMSPSLHSPGSLNTPMKSMQKSASYSGSPSLKRPHTARTERCVSLAMNAVPNDPGFKTKSAFGEGSPSVQRAPATMSSAGITQRELDQMHKLTEGLQKGIPAQRRGEGMGAPRLLPDSKHPFHPSAPRPYHAPSVQRLLNGNLPSTIKTSNLGYPSLEGMGSPLRKCNSFSGSASPSSAREVHNHPDWSKTVEIQSHLKHAGGVHKENCQWSPSPAQSPKSRNGFSNGAFIPSTPGSWS